MFALFAAVMMLSVPVWAEEANFTGDWYGDYNGAVIKMTVNEDGTYILDFAGELQDGTWAQTDEGIQLDDDAIGILTEEGLEPRRTMLLPLTVIGVIITEQALKPLRLRQVIVDLLLLSTTVKFTTLLPQQEVKMYLTVIVGQRTLRSMTEEARHGSQHEPPDAPLHRSARNRLRPQPHHDAHIDTEEPHITGESVEYTT